MELALSIAFGIWFLVGAIFYGFITKIDKKDSNEKLKRKEDKNR